jgi:hypothetical protein
MRRLTLCLIATAALNGQGPPQVEIRAGALSAVVAGNEAANPRRSGYNGLAEVRIEGSESPFVPLFAGWNLEHYFDARPASEDPRILFEPRRAPMMVRSLGPAAAELYQEATAHFGVESWTRFEARESGAVDFTFRCKPHRPLEGGFLGVFWASYLNAPENKGIYFLDAGSTIEKPRWVQLVTQRHNHDSSVPAASEAGRFDLRPGPPALWNNLSPLRYAEPFYYGRWRDYVLIFLFERSQAIRFAHSPSGGGVTTDSTDTNPAWDFQWLIPGAEPGREYTLRGRLVMKRWSGRQDVLREATEFYRQP